MSASNASSPPLAPRTLSTRRPADARALAFTFALALLACDEQPTSEGASGLLAVGPRLVSNHTDRPLIVYGRALPDGAILALDTKPPLHLPTVRIDDDHLGAVLPAGSRLAHGGELHEVRARLLGADERWLEGEATLTIVDDARYPTADELALVGDRLVVSSANTDELFVIDAVALRAGVATLPTRVPVDDGPVGLATWEGHLVVLHRDAQNLWLLDAATGGRSRTLAAPVDPMALAVAGDLAWITSRADGRAHAIDLRTGEIAGNARVGPRPRHVAASTDVVVAASGGAGDLALIEERSPRAYAIRRAAPDRETRIVGGHTAPYQRWIMGGKAARGVVLAPELGVAFVASVGPNIGPNPDRMEVSMNGGISVLDLERGRVVRHRSIERGIPEGLAYDASRALLFAADVATGALVTLDARALATSDAAAAEALLSRTLVTPRDGARLLHPAAPALHTGPRRLVLGADGTLYVLARFSAEVLAYDTTDARTTGLALRGRAPLPTTSQPRRRRGELVYSTDVAGTRMTCDGCHYEGDADGLLFTKGEPMHIYRSTSLWQARETAPYFTPALFPSLAFTASFVLERNRFHHPAPSDEEIAVLTRYQETLTAPASPHRRADGGFPARVTLPDGRVGDPTRGLALFGPACASCHPGPEHTTDQDPATRGRLFDVGTPVALPLRPSLQDDAPYPLPPPGLVGVHARFPLLHSGAGGFEVVADRVEATDLWPLRALLERARDDGRHGALEGASARDLADLEAFLLML